MCGGEETRTLPQEDLGISLAAPWGAVVDSAAAGVSASACSISARPQLQFLQAFFFLGTMVGSMGAQSTRQETWRVRVPSIHGHTDRETTYAGMKSRYLVP